MRKIIRRDRACLISLSVAAAVFAVACSSKPVDPRTIIPSDALVYLETRDLGRAIAAVTDSPAFERSPAKKLDTARLAGVKMSVAVTGFETSEEAVTNQSSVLRLRPRFVAAAETNAWSWQIDAFVVNGLSELIKLYYGREVRPTVSTKFDGKYYVWTAEDGRQAFALVKGSVIFFGNDESAIEKSLAVLRGEVESVVNNPSFTNGDQLAFGFISPDGVAQLANIAGVSLAMNSSDDSEVKSFISRVLPEILRGSVSGATWTATSFGTAIEDKYEITLKPAALVPISETVSPARSDLTEIVRFVPGDFQSATVYDVQSASLAWRNIVSVAQSQTDAVSAKLIGAFSGSLFESYAVENADAFLSAVNGPIMTVQTDAEGGNVAVIAKTASVGAVQKSLAEEFAFNTLPEKVGAAEVWRSSDGAMMAAFDRGFIIAGDSAAVAKCLEAFQSGNSAADFATKLEKAAAFTLFRDAETPARLAAILGGENSLTAQNASVFSAVEVTGVERRTRSAFGLIGTAAVAFFNENAD